MKKNPTLLSIILLISTVACSATEPVSFGPPILFAQVADPDIDEASGLASSMVDPDRYWLLNDSGNAPVIYAVDRRGNTISKSSIGKLGENIDWEALDSFQLDGRSYLMIGDVGDNGAQRTETRLIIVEEPLTLPAPELTIVATLRIRLTDGPADVEAIFVDPIERAIYLLTKRQHPASLWRAPLDLASTAIIAAERVASVSTIPRPTQADIDEDPKLGQYRGQPTDIAMRPDRSGVAVLTYGDAYWFGRRGDATWADALSRTPERIALPRLIQAEGAGFSADGSTLLITSERYPAPLVGIMVAAP